MSLRKGRASLSSSCQGCGRVYLDFSKDAGDNGLEKFVAWQA